MKKLYLLLSLLFLSNTINAQDPDAFIMTFEVTNDTGLDITVPIVQDNANNYTIDFGDGTILTNQTGNVSHTYSTAGIYTVSLTGIFKRITFITSDYKLKLKSVEHWGTNQWSSMLSAFYGCSNLIINATDAPDLSQVTNMSYMFNMASSFNQSINHWDVSNVTNMNHMFSGASSFNQPLDNWDVSNVTNMFSMFSNTTSFNQPLNNWDVSNVTNMSSVFLYATSFNQPLNNWNVSNATNMSDMFWGVTSFNQDLSNWDVSNVTNMLGMFEAATSFNQNLSNWDVSNVTNMAYMFSKASLFNQPLNDWDVSNVTLMGAMFYEASSFNQDLSNWDVSNVTNMSHMFCEAYSFNQNLSNWNFSPYVSLAGFLNDCGLNTINYDLLLQRFVTLELENKTLGANGLQYCDEDTRGYLINDLGWTITGDSLAETEECSLGVNSVETDLFISVYPNPTNGILHISSKENITIEEVKIYNLQGRDLFGSVQHLETINISDLSTGIYLMNIKTNQGSISKRVIKK